jgi:hypothetical protein
LRENHKQTRARHKQTSEEYSVWYRGKRDTTRGSGSVPAAEVERDAAMGPKRQPRALPKERDEAAAAPAPSLAGTGAAAGEAAANLETAAALHAMARTLYYPPTASEQRARGGFCRERMDGTITRSTSPL